jgi:hypothetical protein
MKKIIKSNIVILSLLALVSAFAFSSCKDSDGSPDIKPGTPVLTSITPDVAGGGELITVIGTGLGDMVSIVLEKESVHATVVSTLNTETCIMFRVPSIAEGGSQSVTFTNSKGKTMVTTLNVLAYPTVDAVSNYDYVAGDLITLTGNNFHTVSDIVLTGTSDHPTVISKTKTKMVIQMPVTDTCRTTLDITNLTGLRTTTQEFVCITNAFVCFADDWGTGAFNGGVQSWSYGTNSVAPTGSDFMTGSKSLVVDYQALGGLSMFLGSDTWADGHWFTDFYTPTYLTFWAKAIGSPVDLNCRDDSPPWSGSFPTGSKIVTIPADVWTYVKIPASTWPGPYGRFNIINNDKTAGHVVYFDDILFVK